MEAYSYTDHVKVNQVINFSFKKLVWLKLKVKTWGEWMNASINDGESGVTQLLTRQAVAVSSHSLAHLRSYVLVLLLVRLS